MRTLFSLLVAASLIGGAASVARAQDSKPEDGKQDGAKPDGGAKPDDGQKPDGGAKPDGGRGDRAGRGGRGARGGSMADRLKDTLGLTDDQVKKIKAIEADAKAAVDKAHEGDKAQPGDRGAMRQKFKEIRDKVEEKLKDVLTPEQQKKYDDWKKQMEERRKERGNRGGDKGGDKGGDNNGGGRV